MGRRYTKDYPAKKEQRMSVNKAILLGRLGQDPELKYTPSGQAVCNFSMATSESYTDKSGNKQDKTEWHRIVVWGKLAELCNQYLSKGSEAFIEGNIQTRSWENKEGVKQYTTEINARSVQFIGAKSNSNQEQKQADKNEQTFTADDIPF